MKRVLLAAGMALALSAAPMAAQTRVSVVVGFGVPRPYVTGVVILGRPPVYYPHRRAFYYRPPLFVARRGYVVRHRHHPHPYYYDDDRDYDRDHDFRVTRGVPPECGVPTEGPDAAGDAPGSGARSGPK